MGKKRYTYAGLTATQLKTRSSCPLATDIIIEASNIDCSNINITQVKGVLGTTVTSVSGLCSDANVNKWSGFSPREMYNSSGFVDSRVRTPYELGIFSGYNHSAVIPDTTNTEALSLGSANANQDIAVGFNVNLGEVNWLESGLWSHFHLVEGGIIKGSIDLSTYVANTVVNLSINLLAGGTGTTTNYTIIGYFGSSVSNFTSRLVETDAVCSITILSPPQFSNFILVDSTANQTVIATAESVSWTNQLSCILTDKLIAGNNLQGKYRCTANSDIGLINVGEFGIIRSTVNCYRVRNSVQSSKYAVVSNYRILYSALGTSFDWAIPSALLPQQDGDLFYLEFDNLY